MNSPQSNETENPEAILVIRFSSLGDILLTAPAIRALRRRFPASQIDLLVAEEYRDGAALIPQTNRVLTINREQGIAALLTLRKKISRRYSIIVDLQNSPRSAFLRAFSFPTLWVKAKRYRVRRWLLIKTKRSFYGAPHPVPLRYLEAVEPLGCADDGQGLCLTRPECEYDSTPAFDIVLCPGAKHLTKKWPTENWIDLARCLLSSSLRVAVLGAAHEADQIHHITSASGTIPVTNLSIPQAATLMAQADVVVSNDSGLMHLAAGLNTPLVALFGPTVAEFGFYPFRTQAIVHDHILKCRPCSAHGGSECPQRHFRCMKDTLPDNVFQSVISLLNRPV